MEMPPNGIIRELQRERGPLTGNQRTYSIVLVGLTPSCFCPTMSACPGAQQATVYRRQPVPQNDYADSHALPEGLEQRNALLRQVQRQASPIYLLDEQRRSGEVFASA